MMINLLNAVKACIPTHWTQKSSPTMALWFSKVTEVHNMEKIIAILKGK